MRDAFDVVVVGSGATGGWVAKEMSGRGLSVMVLEAGQAFEPGSSPYQCSRQMEVAAPEGHEVQQRCRVFNERTRRYFINDRENPYTVPPDTPFSWIRTQVVGGKTVVWGGQAYRMSDFDFQASSFDGFGVDWPIRYSDLARHYEKVERFMGVTGTADGIPQLPDGAFTPARPLNPELEQRLRAAIEQNGQRLIVARTAEKPELDHSQPCVHCGRIGQGCFRYTSSLDSTLAAARRTGKMALRSDSLVRHILTDEKGNATGVSVIDKKTRETFEVKGRLIFLCASTLESTRIMLNSKSLAHPHGVGNSSGVLGHYLMDHVYGVHVIGQFKHRNRAAAARLSRPRLLYIPRWQNLDERTHLTFLRGYSYLVYLAPLEHAFVGSLGCFNTPAMTKPAFAAGERALLQDRFVVGFYPFGEMLPRYENYVQINEEGKVDAWGVPILSIHCRYGPNEQAMAADMVATARQTMQTTGGIVMKTQETLSEPGLCVHEVGTCRMGADPKASVLNSYNQCHDVPNLFVTDGSAFPSQGTQSPTLTMMALSVRACEYAVERLRRGALPTGKLAP